MPLWSPEPEVLNSVPADPVMTIERAVDLYLEDKKEQQAGDALTGKRCHIHMFRDTFAVELLLAGVPIEQVSRLLGHKSIRVTEKHYSPWVQARQEQLEASVQKAWATKP